MSKAINAESAEGYTLLTWGEEVEARKYFFTRGAIAWPKGMAPGIILIAGQTPDGKVEVFEEREFKTLTDAARIIIDWRPRFLAKDYYTIYGDCNFVSDLDALLREGKVEDTRFAEDNVDFGNTVINEYLHSNRLSVPRNGILHRQFELNWQDTGPTNQPLHGIEALRYLMVGIKSHPWNPPDKGSLPRRYPMSLSEVLALDIEQAYREAREDYDFEDYENFM